MIGRVDKDALPAGRAEVRLIAVVYRADLPVELVNHAAVAVSYTHLDQAVEDKAGRNTVRNAVAQRHKHAREESWNRLVELRPLDLGKGGEHHNADNDERRSRRSGRNGADKRRKEGAERKADRNDNARKALSLIHI